MIFVCLWWLWFLLYLLFFRLFVRNLSWPIELFLICFLLILLSSYVWRSMFFGIIQLHLHFVDFLSAFFIHADDFYILSIVDYFKFFVIESCLYFQRFYVFHHFWGYLFFDFSGYFSFIFFKFFNSWTYFSIKKLFLFLLTQLFRFLVYTLLRKDTLVPYSIFSRSKPFSAQDLILYLIWAWIFDLIDKLVIIGQSSSHLFGLIEGQGLSQVEGHFVVLTHQYFSHIFQMFYSSQEDGGIKLITTFLSNLMDVFQLFEAVRCYSKGGHPIVAGIGNEGDETKIFWLETLPMIIGEGWLSNIQFILVLTVRAKEEGDASEEQTEQSSNIGQNNVKFADSSLDG